MDLPEITHVQYAILSRIKKPKTSGKEIRENLDWRRSLSAFHHSTRILEDKGYMTSNYYKSMQPNKGVHYTLTVKGKEVVKKSLEFYADK